jgi:hypothetical protein
VGLVHDGGAGGGGGAFGRDLLVVVLRGCLLLHFAHRAVVVGGAQDDLFDLLDRLFAREAVHALVAEVVEAADAVTQLVELPHVLVARLAARGEGFEAVERVGAVVGAAEPDFLQQALALVEGFADVHRVVLPIEEDSLEVTRLGSPSTVCHVSAAPRFRSEACRWGWSGAWPYGACKVVSAFVGEWGLGST